MASVLLRADSKVDRDFAIASAGRRGNGSSEFGEGVGSEFRGSITAIAATVRIAGNSLPTSAVADSQLQGIAAFPRRDRTIVLNLARGQGRIYRSDGSVRTERKSDFHRFERFRVHGPPSLGGMESLKCDHSRAWIGTCVLAFGPLPPARVQQSPWPDEFVCVADVRCPLVDTDLQRRVVRTQKLRVWNKPEPETPPTRSRWFMPRTHWLGEPAIVPGEKIWRSPSSSDPVHL